MFALAAYARISGRSASGQFQTSRMIDHTSAAATLLPLNRRQAIEKVSAKGVVCRRPRMSELRCRMRLHAKPLYHPQRRCVGGGRLGQDLREDDPRKRVVERRRGGLGRVTLVPVLAVSHQPISKAGVNVASNGTAVTPANPMDVAGSGSSTAHRPCPRSESSASMRRAQAKLRSSSSVPGKWRIASGSEFIRANGAQSSRVHRLRRSLAICNKPASRCGGA